MNLHDKIVLKNDETNWAIIIYRYSIKLNVGKEQCLENKQL